MVKKKGCDFFIKDCNVKKSSEEITNPNQTTVRKSLFINEFCSGSTKSTCSPGRLSRGLCDNIIAAGLMRLNQYKRIDEEDYWSLYGNEYADYCPISISETEFNNNPKYSYIGNCNIGKKIILEKIYFISTIIIIIMTIHLFLVITEKILAILHFVHFLL